MRLRHAAEAEAVPEDEASDEADSEEESDVEDEASEEEDGATALIEVPEEPEWADSPVPELLPVIGVGHWVRLKKSKGVPAHLVGRDAVVLRAPVRKAEGDKLSPTPYEYQDGSEEFLVRSRDTGEELSLSRASFASFDTDAVRLTAA